MLSAAVFIGCRDGRNAPAPDPGPPATATATQAPPPQPSYAMTNAQPKLPTVTLWLGPQEIEAEVARTTVQIATGMMFRKTMGENEGMLFVFLRPHRTSFYMRNTYIPLSIAYIDTEGQIRELHDMEPLNENVVPAETDEIQYVLEMKKGWFERNKIGVGAVVRTELGSLRETFFRRPGQ